MEKVLKVSKAAQGKKYTNVINLKGEYLKDFGFARGSFVKVYITTNKIVVEKI